MYCQIQIQLYELDVKNVKALKMNHKVSLWMVLVYVSET